MWLSAKITFSEVNQAVASFGLPLFIVFDELGSVNCDQSKTCAHGDTLYRNPVVLNHDHCEDG